MKILKIEEEITPVICTFLKKGEVVVLPTDTVYGLVCGATNVKAVRKIFEIKNRPQDKPIGIFAKDIEMAKRFAKIDKEQEKFLIKLGNNLANITFVLKQRKDGGLPKILFGEKDTIGIRIPDYRLIQDLFGEIDFPLAQTSANISGQPATTKIKEVLKQFEKAAIKPDLILDAGELKEAEPSTVLDLTVGEPQILREGEVSREAVFKIF